jgi:hypothetical protein
MNFHIIFCLNLCDIRIHFIYDHFKIATVNCFKTIFTEKNDEPQELEKFWKSTFVLRY